MNNRNHSGQSDLKLNSNEINESLASYFTVNFLLNISYQVFIYFGEKLKKNDANLGSAPRTQLQLRISFHAETTTRVTFLTSRCIPLSIHILDSTIVERFVGNRELVTLLVTTNLYDIHLDSGGLPMTAIIHTS